MPPMSAARLNTQSTPFVTLMHSSSERRSTSWNSSVRLHVSDPFPRLSVRVNSLSVRVDESVHVCTLGHVGAGTCVRASGSGPLAVCGHVSVYCMHACMHVCMYACVCVRACVRACACVHACVRACVRMGVSMPCAYVYPYGTDRSVLGVKGVSALTVCRILAPTNANMGHNAVRQTETHRRIQAPQNTPAVSSRRQ